MTARFCFEGCEKGPRQVRELRVVLAAAAPAGGSTETASPGDLERPLHRHGKAKSSPCTPAQPSLLCRVWFPVSLLMLCFPPGVTGRGTLAEVGPDIFESTSAATQTRAVLSWNGLFQGKLSLGNQRVFLSHLGPGKVGGS